MCSVLHRWMVVVVKVDEAHRGTDRALHMLVNIAEIEASSWHRIPVRPEA